MIFMSHLYHLKNCQPLNKHNNSIQSLYPFSMKRLYSEVINRYIYGSTDVPLQLVYTKYNYAEFWDVLIKHPESVYEAELPTFVSCNQEDFVQQFGRYIIRININRGNSFHHQGDCQIWWCEHGQISTVLLLNWFDFKKH